ncbi:hypothetical protein AB1L88_08185 [Tautonia sp. JC769]|uniref:hypothetical protein n=1 Tax=Tautonia sp. JC769 TaxID=3232135 RepID=UPI00345B22E5
MPRLLVMVGILLMGSAPVEGRPTRSGGGGRTAEAFDVPITSGVAAFDLPPDCSEEEVVLIVSAMSHDGTFAAECAMTPAGEGIGLTPLRSIGTGVPAGEAISPDSTARPRESVQGVRPDRPVPTAHPLLRRGFSVRVRPGDPRSPSNYDLIDARLRAVGERIQVFVDDDDLAVVGDDVLRTIVSSFDRVIEPRLSARIGPVRDVDRDGRFTVLLSRRIRLPFPDRSHVDGYFRSTDLDQDLPRPLSNRADMVYLDAGIQAGPYLETVLAHEYGHAVLESRRRDLGPPLVEESWLDEAMAHLCEDLVGRSTENLDYRVSAFLSEPRRCSVRVEDEHRPGRFRSHGNRGASYLFLRWCAGRSDGDFLLRLCSQGAVGVPNLERAAGRPFDELYRQWSVTNALESLGAGTDSGGSFHLLGTMGDWPMAGVRFATIDPETPEHSFTLEATSSQYLRLAPDPETPARVVVRCDPAARPIVTLVRVPRRHPDLRFEVRVKELGPDVATVVARVEERAGLNTSLERLSWEPNLAAASAPRSRLSAHTLDGDALRSLFPEPALAPGDHLTSAPFQIPSDQLALSPLVFRLSARTDDGRRGVSWAELIPPPPGLARPSRPPSLEPPPGNPLGSNPAAPLTRRR